MDSSPKTAPLRYGGLALALAAAIGILGANAFADAAGFYDSSWGRDPVRPLCGIVLFVLAWMLLRFLFQLGTQVAWRLGQVRERPGLPITIALLACGTLCVLGSLLVVWHGDPGGMNLSPAMNLPKDMPGANMLPRFDLSMRTTGTLIRPLAVSAALVIGVALLALGVWSSLVPAATSAAAKSVPEESGAS